MKMSKKRILFLICSLCFLLVVAYYVGAILWARHKTPQLVEEWLRKDIITLQPSELSKGQTEILLAVQDPSFRSHCGVTFTAKGTGWTTITQSVVKFLYFNPFKPGIRKIEQALIARFALFPLSTKDEQLTLFINVIWFRNGLRGLRPAAKFYFGKDVQELSEDQFIALVAMLNAPRFYDIKDHPKRNKERVERIKRMLSGEYVLKSLFDTEYNMEG